MGLTNSALGLLTRMSQGRTKPLRGCLSLRSTPERRTSARPRRRVTSVGPALCTPGKKQSIYMDDDNNNFRFSNKITHLLALSAENENSWRIIFNPNVDQRGNHPAGFQHGIPSRVSRVHEVVRLEGHHEAAHCRQTRRSQIQLQAMPKGINISFIWIIYQPSGILLSPSPYTLHI